MSTSLWILDGLVGLEQIDKSAIRIALNRHVWNQGYVVECVHKQPRIYELVEEKGLVLVLKQGLLAEPRLYLNNVTEVRSASPVRVLGLSRFGTSKIQSDFA